MIRPVKPRKPIMVKKAVKKAIKKVVKEDNGDGIMRKPIKPRKSKQLKTKPTKYNFVKYYKQISNKATISDIKEAISNFYLDKGISPTVDDINNAILHTNGLYHNKNNGVYSASPSGYYGSYGSNWRYMRGPFVCIMVKEENRDYDKQLKEYKKHRKENIALYEKYEDNMINYENRMLTYKKHLADKEERRSREKLNKIKANIEAQKKRVLEVERELLV